MRFYVSEATRNVFISAQESYRQIKEHHWKTKQKTKEKMFLVDENVLFFQASQQRKL